MPDPKLVTSEVLQKLKISYDGVYRNQITKAIHCALSRSNYSSKKFSISNIWLEKALYIIFLHAIETEDVGLAALASAQCSIPDMIQYVKVLPLGYCCSQYSISVLSKKAEKLERSQLLPKVDKVLKVLIKLPKKTTPPTKTSLMDGDVLPEELVETIFYDYKFSKNDLMAARDFYNLYKGSSFVNISEQLHLSIHTFFKFYFDDLSSLKNEDALNDNLRSDSRHSSVEPSTSSSREAETPSEDSDAGYCSQSHKKVVLDVSDLEAGSLHMTLPRGRIISITKPDNEEPTVTLPPGQIISITKPDNEESTVTLPLGRIISRLSKPDNEEPIEISDDENEREVPVKPGGVSDAVRNEPTEESFHEVVQHPKRAQSTTTSQQINNGQCSTDNGPGLPTSE